MSQLKLFLVPPVNFRHKTHAEMQALVYAHGQHFARKFDVWLWKNFPIQCACCDLALHYRNLGFKRYGIANIWEELRRHTRHAEVESQYKLTNLWRADVARLILLAYPESFPLDYFVLKPRSPGLLGCYDQL